jgi:hypothetical protein
VIRLVVYRVNVRSQRDVRLVLQLLADGLSASEVARLTRIPRSTVRDWRCGRIPRPASEDPCLPGHTRTLDRDAYAYLLGMYLGDGCISACARDVMRLRVTLDATHPRIAAECAAAIEAVTPAKHANLLWRRDQRSVEVSCYWKHWSCLFPQHGPGPKHLRRIVLAEWQEKIVSMNREPFIRGLIHSDGTRIIATERKGNYVRRAPRYAFTNRSEDILELFRQSCAALDVHCTRASAKQIAVYSKAAVARLDEFVGPKG